MPDDQHGQCKGHIPKADQHKFTDQRAQRTHHIQRRIIDTGKEPCRIVLVIGGQREHDPDRERHP